MPYSGEIAGFQNYVRNKPQWKKEDCIIQTPASLRIFYTKPMSYYFPSKTYEVSNLYKCHAKINISATCVAHGLQVTSRSTARFKRQRLLITLRGFSYTQHQNIEPSHDNAKLCFSSRRK